jgi:2,3-bisphosphoglycerate-dependent phosphoglycerate mutase
MRLYLIRHGQSSNNALWAQTQSEKGRSLDPGLTDLGRAQAERVAGFLRDELGQRQPLTGLFDDSARPTLFYTSLMTRAVATGVILARVLQTPLVTLSAAHEAGGLYLTDETTGERVGMEGPNRAHFETHFPDLQLPADLGESGWWNRPFEASELRPERARQVWQELRARHGSSDDVIGLVTHGGFYNHLLAAILNLPPREDVWFTLNNCAVSRLDLGAHGISLTYLNRFDFLPAEWITL